MPSYSLDRFKKRQKLKHSISVYTNEIRDDEVNEFLNSDCNTEKVNSVYKATKKFYDMSVSEAEAKKFLEEFKKEFSQARFDQMISDLRNNVIQSIVTPFGLGKAVSAYDKVGGNVTTIHNTNNKEFVDSDGTKYKGGIYAKDEDKYSRTDYTHRKNSNGEQFAGAGEKSIGSQFTRSKMDENGYVEDAYTGRIQKADTTSPDHKNSISQFHKDGGFMLNSTEKADFATDADNMALTDRSINQSMRDYDPNEWKEKVDSQGIKNKDRFGINEEKFDTEMRKAKPVKEKHLPTDTEKTIYYAKNMAITGVSEAGKMGLQQAMGAILVELFASLIDEVTDVYKNGWDVNDDGFFMELGRRLQTISNKITAKWKDFAKAFKDGAISGFISNIVTTINNMFETTGKRIVRIIREGIFSLFKALKILIFPPEGLSYSDALHEAKKLVVGGLIVAGGVMLEEWLETLIKASVFLEPFADILTGILVGTLTGLTVSLALYYLDKKKNDKDAINVMIVQTGKKFDRLESYWN